MKKIALITGASRGIGYQIAKILSPDHTLYLGGRDSEVLEKLSQEFPSAHPWPAELTDFDSLAQRVEPLPRLDLLVHSAGIIGGGTIGDTSWQTWRNVLDTNLIAVAELTRLCLPLLRESQGQVITINSGSGYFSGPGGGLYSASKFALRAFTDALREEERGRVRVSSIHPGRVDTDMQVEIQAEAGRPYRADDHLRADSVAKAVRLAVDASPEAMVEELSIRPVRGRLT